MCPDCPNDSTHTQLQVLCIGKEERLLDCNFPQMFGDQIDRDYYVEEDYYGNPVTLPRPNDFPEAGLESCNRDFTRQLSVVCRKFEITGVTSPTLDIGL